ASPSLPPAFLLLLRAPPRWAPFPYTTLFRSEIAAVLREDIAHARDRAGGVVGRALDEHGDAVRRIALVQDHVVVRRFFTRRASNRCFDLVLGHVDRAPVLDDPPEGGIRGRVGPAGLHGDRDVLADARELLRHTIPAREHRMFSGFENATHAERTL